ncbi:MAG: MBL fold metallo-hydrolase [Thermomicrobiales bacterium]|nr:MAG: MBL fold metallo-hydrolase [Thermomicrobiales bacterium]
MGVVVHSLASGSSGNAMVIGDGQSAILLDCGLPGARLTARLREIGLSITSLTALLLSHEHTDHIQGIKPVLRAKLPVLTLPGTARAAGLDGTLVEPLSIGVEYSVGAFTITALGVSHDATEPVGFFLRHPEASITVITDLGREDEALIEPLAHSDVIVVEANHDRELLWRGPYPIHLKRRVAAPTGHLSNDECAALLLRALKQSERKPAIWLAHLSETNNRPDLAVATVTSALSEIIPAERVRALPRRDVAQCWQSDPERDRAGVARQLSFLP